MINNEYFNFKRVLFINIILFFIVPIILILRLFYIQIWLNKELSEMVKKQVSKVVDINVLRGDIKDRYNKTLATSLEYETIEINCKEFLKGLNLKSNNLSNISKLLNIDEKELLKKCKKERYIIFDEEIQPINLLSFKSMRGVEFVKRQKRVYPYKDLACYVLGKLNSNNEGYSGIEAQFEQYLNSKKKNTLAVFKNGNINNISLRPVFYKDIKKIETQKGNYSLILTLDAKMQYAIENIIEQAYQNLRPKMIIAIVQEPNSGEILTLAIAPKKEIVYINSAVSEAFEPGSIFKIFPIAIFLEEKVIKQESVFYCENGKFCFAGNVISDLHSYKNLTLEEILVYSSNIGMAKAYLSFNDPEKYYSWIRKFGFGSLTGIDIPGEIKGFVPYKKSPSWSKYQPIFMSFGQGLSVSAIQIVNAYSAIANGGYLLKPSIVKYIVNDENEPLLINQKMVIRDVCSKNTTDIIKDMLEETVLKGTAVGAKIEGLSICAKTGTAQVFDKQKGKYSNERSIMSTCGFFPKQNTKYVIGVFVFEPKKGRVASEVAVPLFKKIIQEIVNFDGEMVYAKAN